MSIQLGQSIHYVEVPLEKKVSLALDIDFSLLKRGKKISPEKAFRGFREGFLTSHERLIKGHLVRRPYVVKGSV